MLVTRTFLATFFAVLSLLLTIPPSGAGAAGTYQLTGRRQPGELARIELTVQGGGELKLVADDKTNKLPMSVTATLHYDEKVLPPKALDASTPGGVRFYDKAEATIKVSKGGEKPTLRKDRCLVCVQRDAVGILLYSPHGPFTREELDLIEVPGNSLVIDDLLPTQPVAVGATWKHSESVMAALLGLDAASFTSAQSTLATVENDVARSTMVGSVTGTVDGVSTEIEVKAKYNYNLRSKRITWFALLVKEQRSVGHVGPGVDAVTKLLMKISPLSQSSQLEDPAIAAIAQQPQQELSYRAPGGAYSLSYGRDWYVTGEERDLTILRLVEKGDLIAQCNISPIKSATAATPITLAEFQRDIQRSLGKSFGQFVHASHKPQAGGLHVFRVVAQGETAQMPIQWIYYVIDNARGQRVSLSFTLEASLAERFGQADRLLAGSLQLAEPPVQAAAKPTATPK